MLTKIEVTKTYWVGMTLDQKSILPGAIVKCVSNAGAYAGDGTTVDHLSQSELEVLQDFRQAALS